MADGPAPDRASAPRVPDTRATPWSPPHAAEQAPAAYHWPFGEPVSAPEPPRSPRRRAGGTAGVIALAAVTALLVGGGAGFGAARLSERPASTSVSDPAPSEPAPAPVPSGETTTTVEVARRALPGTVMIEVRGSGEQGTGSGFVLDREGHIMTNNHVVAGAADGARLRVVFSDGRRTSATLVGRSPSYDLAVIKVDADERLRPLETGDSSSARVGATVVAVGSPLGLPGTVTQGIVSAVDRPVTVNESGSADAPTAYIDGIQTDAPINPGNSGGPLVDASARVVGVNSAILTLGSGQGQAGNIGIGFAIPINQARTIGDLLVKDGRATYPVVGVQLRETSRGVELSSVEAGGAARKAGLRAGDLVSSVDERRVTTREELVVAVRTHRPGEVVRFGYTRDGAKTETDVTLGGKVG
ncbi:putative serine protease PepD [Microlunatus sagamiharensis]|uniref:Putative serine protease PepD n=1 Tax=Microlunatus sagamiharensis TaxID=546874 RepID=A0A1H2MU35_9ACTN|nr:trypsin-like peptidase domain-containing protein [Microlunatus sagamiharensis]SDU96445.1 putative serine protease PepD [Microlunatus sagamiharensis]